MKKVLFTIALMLLPLMASADKVLINGIYYYLDSEAKTAEVTSMTGNHYWGDVTIPETVKYDDVIYSVTNIGYGAFYGCINLTSVSIPNSVTSIGLSAFENCSGLTSVTIGNNVTKIGDYAFDNCSGLTSITIPNSVTSIGEAAFSECSGLTSINIPDGVTKISNYTFKECSSLTSVNIPNSVTDIGSYAFYKCSSLTSINIPSSVTFIAYEFVFFGCNSLTAITVDEANTSYKSVDGVLLSKNGTWLKTYPIGKAETTYTIPDGVTYIDKYAFSGCGGLTSITIPNSVNDIRDYAFSACSGLTSIDIPNSVTFIGEGAFSGCSGLTSVSIPNSVNLGFIAFDGCDGLTSVTISTQIIHEWFRGNTSIQEVILGEGVDHITHDAFAGCSGLTSISIPSSVTTIDSGAFTDTGWYNEQSDGLLYLDGWLLGYKGDAPTGEITIADGTKRIANDAFYNCSDLTSITIPDGVTIIGTNAFSGCSGLLDIYCYAENVPTIRGSNFINFDQSNVTLHVPDASVNDYSQASIWHYFKKILGMSGIKCATPTINVVGGEVTFECETEGVTYKTTYQLDNSANNIEGETVVLGGITTCQISVYATKEGYKDSDVATANVEITWGTKGDMNNDGVVNAADVVKLVNYIAGKEEE